MSEVFLEISFHGGKPFAAYLRLPRDHGAKIARTREVRPGLVVDFAADGKPMGIEIVHPSQTSAETILAVIEEVHAAPVSLQELAPLRAA
jgi:uncharacterized protein YuzE